MMTTTAQPVFSDAAGCLSVFGSSSRAAFGSSSETWLMRSGFDREKRRQMALGGKITKAARFFDR